jgi:hypothetical protein
MPKVLLTSINFGRGDMGICHIILHRFLYFKIQNKNKNKVKRKEAIKVTFCNTTPLVLCNSGSSTDPEAT